MQFSIIVPVYNVAPFLPRCLDSVTGQTFPDYEVWVIDDGSTDGSGVICDRYAQKNSRVHVIHQENQGLSGARNTGLQHAQGQWIAFVDSDDWVEPEMLAEISSEIKEHPAEMYCFNAKKIDENGKLIENLIFNQKSETIVFNSEKERLDFYVYHLMEYEIGWEAWSRVYARDLICTHKMRFTPTQEIFAEDYLFAMEYLLYADRIRRMSGIYYNYFQREGSLLRALKLETVLPRLVCLGELEYEHVKQADLKLMRRQYFKIYFTLLNFHLRTMLSVLPEQEVKAYLWSRERSRQHKIWMRQMALNRFQLRYKGGIKWLRRKK